MHRNNIGLVWLGGLVLAASVYAIGPDHFAAVVLAWIDQAQIAVARFLRIFSFEAFSVVRALAIGLFAVFVVLGVMAAQRGLRAWRALVIVSGLFFWLLYDPLGDGLPTSTNRWFAAFTLAAVAAAVMTRRLTAPQGARSPAMPESGPFGH